jgi:hypothetical protein
VDAALVRRLYDVEADVIPAPGDGAQVVVPGAGAFARGSPRR